VALKLDVSTDPEGVALTEEGWVEVAARATVAPPTPAWVTVGVTVCEDPSPFFTWMRVVGPALNLSPDAAAL
jgi:hypothetical protein